MSRGFSTIYVGRVDSRTRERDLSDVFDRFGRVARVDMKRGFAFIDYEDTRDAEDAIRDMDGREVDGSRLIVEWAGRGRGSGGGGGGRDRGGDRGGDRYGDRDRRGPSASSSDRRRAGQRPDHSDHRIRLEDIPSSAHWQDLKDFCRKAGEVIFGDVDRKGTGVVEFRYAEDVARAVRDLDNTDWNGHKVRVIDDSGKRSRSRSPRRSSKSPRRGASKSPRRGSSKSPRRGASKSPRRGSKSPRRSRSKSPRRSASRSPKRSASPSPKRSPSPNKDAEKNGDKPRSPSAGADGDD